MNSVNNFKQIRQCLITHQSYSQAARQAGEYYRLDRGKAVSYFNIHKKWQQLVRDYLYGLQEKEKQVVHIDICGCAEGFALGATKSYCLALRTPEYWKKICAPNHIIMDADIFNDQDFIMFIKLIKQNGVAPALVTFNPVAGLQDHGPDTDHDGIPLYRDITYKILANRLRDIIKLMRPGGYVYLERAFQSDVEIFSDWFNNLPQHKWQYVRNLRKITKRYGCTTQLGKTIGGPHLLIRTAQQNN